MRLGEADPDPVNDKTERCVGSRRGEGGTAGVPCPGESAREDSSVAVVVPCSCVTVLGAVSRLGWASSLEVGEAFSVLDSLLCDRARDRVAEFLRDIDGGGVAGEAVAGIRACVDVELGSRSA